MYLANMLFRVLITFVVLIVYSLVYYRSANRKIFNKVILFLHIVVLSMFFVGAFSNISYFLFDVIWWSMAGTGIISCIDLIGNRSKFLFLLLPTTTVFTLFVFPMLLLDSM